MLLTALGDGSDSVFVDLLTYADLVSTIRLFKVFLLARRRVDVEKRATRRGPLRGSTPAKPERANDTIPELCIDPWFLAVFLHWWAIARSRRRLLDPVCGLRRL